jgi:hypothetical protein
MAKVEAFKNLKNKPPNTSKAGLQSPEEFLVCWSVVVRVPR